MIISFYDTLKQKVSTSRYQATRAINRELILLYHHIGAEILARQATHGWGAGYRVYFGREHNTLIILLGGGSKRTQSKDIDLSKTLWQHYKKTK